jgi:hypothetical protein
MSSNYAGADSQRVNTAGGSVRVTIASNVGQGNGGTSLPCRRVWIISNGTDVRVTIGVACTSTTGIPVPWFVHDTTATQAVSQYAVLELAIDDVSSLYFYGGTNAKVVDILYAK